MPASSRNTLNARQEAFCRGLVEGKAQARSDRDAGYTATGNAAEVNAARLLRNAQVAARVTELQAKAAVRVELTVADIVAELEEARQFAFGCGQPTAAVRASEVKAKLLGLFPAEKLDLSTQVISMPSPIPLDKTEVTVSEWQATVFAQGDRASSGFAAGKRPQQWRLIEQQSRDKRSSTCSTS